MSYYSILNFILRDIVKSWKYKLFPRFHANKAFLQLHAGIIILHD